MKPQASFLYPFFSIVLVATVACGDDTDTNDNAGGNGGSSTTATGGGGQGAGDGGQRAVGGSQGGSDGGMGGDGEGGQGGDPFACTTARDTALGPIDEVSTGDVTILTDAGGTKEVFVDASAGGFQMASTHPAVYIDLDAATRVDITDPAAFDHSGWDIALKRVAIRNNSEHAGAGDGAAAFLAGAVFADVDLADATGAMLEEEAWFDDQCNWPMDPTGSLITTMSEWYDYNPKSMTVGPKDGVYVVRGADGTSYFKVQIVDYYAEPDGTPGGWVSGRYVLRIATL